jgi:hypothetical protein
MHDMNYGQDCMRNFGDLVTFVGNMTISRFSFSTLQSYLKLEPHCSHY